MRRALPLLVLVLVLVALVFAIRAPASPPPLPTPTSAITPTPAAPSLGLAWRPCVQKVTALLRSPSTAAFPSVTDAETRVTGGTRRIESYVDSQNGFGAVIRTRWWCEATAAADGSVTLTGDLSG